MQIASRNEWGDRDDSGNCFCPECHMGLNGGRHAPDCQLDKLLEVIK